MKGPILAKQSVYGAVQRVKRVTPEHKFSPHTERDSDDSHFETNRAKGGPKVKVTSQERNVELCYVIRNREII